MDTEGDALFAFGRAPGALAADAPFTEAFASWAGPGAVWLHTGKPLLAEEGYVGEAVHLAAASPWPPTAVRTALRWRARRRSGQVTAK